TIDDGRTEVHTGQVVEYTATIGNTGGLDATGVKATVTLPAGVEYVSVSDGGTHDAGTVSWPIFDLASGASVPRTVTARVTAEAGDTIEVGTAVEDDGTKGEDVTPGNNVDTDVNTVVVAPPDLSVTIDDGRTEVEPG